MQPCPAEGGRGAGDDRRDLFTLILTLHSARPRSHEGAAAATVLFRRQFPSDSIQYSTLRFGCQQCFQRLHFFSNHEQVV